jgi:hypothetical protein
MFHCKKKTRCTNFSQRVISYNKFYKIFQHQQIKKISILLFSDNYDHWTSGSSLGVQDKPRWCGTDEIVNISAFNWNSGSGYSSDVFQYHIVFHRQSTLAASSLKNVLASLPSAIPLCEN